MFPKCTYISKFSYDWSDLKLNYLPIFDSSVQSIRVQRSLIKEPLKLSMVYSK